MHQTRAGGPEGRAGAVGWGLSTATACVTWEMSRGQLLTHRSVGWFLETVRAR